MHDFRGYKNDEIIESRFYFYKSDMNGSVWCRAVLIPGVQTLSLIALFKTNRTQTHE